MSKVQLDAVLKLVDVQITPQVFRKISQAVAGMPASLAATNKQLQSASNNASNLNRQLKGTANQLSQNEKAARMFLQRMAQFAILLPTFSTLNRAIQGSVKFLFEFDSALRDIIRVDVSGLSHRMEEIGDAALSTAVDLGVLSQEVLSVTKTFVQAGLSIEAAQQRAQLAIVATQVSTLSSANAVEFFISAANQFRLSNDQLAASLDALVKVEDLAAVEAQDVAEAFRTGGNSLAEFAKDINDAIGLISALREQTRKSGREIGTFFKTLQTRIFAAGESRDAVESLGVSVENLDGTLRPTLDVLNDLKVRFDQLNEAQSANAAKAIAGVRQFESLIATLNSLERANVLASKAATSAGSVDEKRLITDAKLERQLGKLIARGQQLAESLGDAGLEEAMAEVLKIASSLLKVFTLISDAIAGIGGNITPLLALGGVLLGKSVFGLSKNGAPGGGQQAPQPGQQNFIGPLTAAQKAMTQTLQQNSAQMKASFTQIIASSRMLANALVPTTTASKQFGVNMGTNVNIIKQHTAALKTQISAFKASAAGMVNNVKENPLLTVGTTLFASVLPGAIDATTEALRKLDHSAVDFGADILDTSSAGLSLGTQFLALGPQAAALGFIFGSLQSSIVKIIDSVQEEVEARDELKDAVKAQGRELSARAKLSSKTERGDETANKIFDAITESFRNQEDFTKAQSNATENIGRVLGLSAEEAGKVFFTKLTSELAGAADVRSQWGVVTTGFLDDLTAEFKSGEAGIMTLIRAHQDLLLTRAEENGTLEEAQSLIDDVNDGTVNASEANIRLRNVLDETNRAVNDLSGSMEIATTEFEQFSKLQSLKGLADEIRTLSLELDAARQGPDAFATALKKLEHEFQLIEREGTNNIMRLEQEMSVLFSQLPPFAKKSASEIFTALNDGISLDPQKIKEFEDLVFNPDPQNFSRMSEVQRKASQDVLNLFKARFEEEKKIQLAANAVSEERNRITKEMFDAEAQAAQNAYEATRKFNSQLREFGDTVTKQTLAAFQNINLEDVDNVLSGTSGLDVGLQQMILSAFADPVAKAELALEAASASLRSEMDILTNRMDIVNAKIADASNESQIASLVAEKHAIALQMEQTAQQGALGLTELKVKILEAEREAEEEAAEAARKRADLLDKLADASHNFENELRSVQRSFEDFELGKINDLLGQEASARSELKDAQQDVLDTTVSLSDAYDNFMRAILEFNGVVAEAHLKSNLLARDISMLNGEIFTFDQGLSSLGHAFRSVLDDANITIAKRIDLERQLAEETLSFLRQARDEIVGAGLGIFGQTGAENQALGQGIAGLQLIADQLGGSFESFLNLTQSELTSVTENLLSLPVEFRQQILDALSFLPSTTSIGGFSVDQLRQAIGQVGAGVAPDAGLPSIEELNSQQVDQLTKLQELALQDSQLQFAQVLAAEQQLAAAEEAAEAAQLLETRAAEGLEAVRATVAQELGILDSANIERRELLNAVIAADDKNTLMQIEREAQLFAEQNSAFRDIGDNIVRGISSAIGARLAVLEAGQNVAQAVNGFIPNFAGGNLTPGEAAALLRAGAREKRAMPGGAGLAVANTSEAIIPMRANGQIPNFQSGSDISAGISAIRGINETVAAAISRSVTSALADLESGSGQTPELLQEIIGQLTALNNTSDDISTVTATVATNTANTGTDTAAPTQTNTAQRVEIVLQTNQNNTVSITGLENLRSELEAAVEQTTASQVDAQVETLFEQLDEIITALQERGILSSFGTTR